jgi:hypothetical protein
VATIARAVAERRELARPDEQCELLAAIGLLVLGRAMDRWLRGPASRGLGDQVAAEFANLTRLVCAPATGPRPLPGGVHQAAGT